MKCGSCKKEKSSEDFHKRSGTKRGRKSSCKDCRKKEYYENPGPSKLRSRKSYYKNYARNRKRNKEWAEKNREKMNGYKLQWRARNEAARKAHFAVDNALRNKKIKRMPCIKCGAKKSHAHHPNYFEKLKVAWLCAKHHSQVHHGKHKKKSIA